MMSDVALMLVRHGTEEGIRKAQQQELGMIEL